ncbi:hypothetical protein [Gordonia alkaliphila]
MTLAATSASAALLMGGITAPPANAVIDIGLPGVVSCDPGKSESSDPLLGPESKADCTDAQTSVIATIGDAILGVVLPDFPLGLSSLNGAIAVPVQDPLGAVTLVPAFATISGTGYNTALAILGGNATASSDYFASGAIAIAALDGTANADALFGGALALGVAGTATAQALPLGIAIANAMPIIGGGSADATALGGIATATTTIFGDRDVVCTALYGTASIADEDGKSQGSCTSVLFIFQQNSAGEGEPTWYAIKNPFDVGLMSPFGDNFADLMAGLGGVLPLPPELIDLMAGKFVPQFQSDLVRISFDGGSPKVESDLPDFLGGLFGQNDTSATTNASATAPETLSAQVDGAPATASTVESTPEPVVIDDGGDSGANAPAAVDLLGGDSGAGSPGGTGDLLSIG